MPRPASPSIPQHPPASASALRAISPSSNLSNSFDCAGRDSAAVAVAVVVVVAAAAVVVADAAGLFRSSFEILGRKLRWGKKTAFASTRDSACY